MSETHPRPDRSRDLSQPVERLSADERLKAGSDQLRGTIREGLADPLTGAVSANDAKLLKFHGMYLQDDRDVRDERRRQKLEPAFQFMIRVRMPGGVCTTQQWLKLDELARTHGNATLRLTTRQTVQFHWVLKNDLRPLIQGLSEARLDTISACGDDARGVMCSVNPHLSALHSTVYDLAHRASDRAIPRMRAYREIWYGEAREREPAEAPEEPFYGKTYMPRKFKIGFAIPPVNDIDVYTQDLGFIAIAENGELKGFNVAIGGGMGRSDQSTATYPRLADVIGFVTPDKVLETSDAVMSVQRDYGDRLERAHARFKYTIDDLGLDWVTAEIERRLGFTLAPARPYTFTSNGDTLGWQTGDDGAHHLTLFVENGRLENQPDRPLLDGLREIARVHDDTLRLTPNQNITIARVSDANRERIEQLARDYRLLASDWGSALRVNSMACVALPTCGLAMAESERYLPSLIARIEALLERHRLSDVPITVRMSGCPNGCSRPYVAEIGLSGRAPGKYNLYLGGGFHGERLARMYLENVGEDGILDTLDKTLGHFARERHEGEHFGDFVVRAGYVEAVTSGRDFNR
ncbi:sulfite reductase (NADPH) beta subunit [Trinickia symbiotica]|uniref:Sulfite reductase [NADPH] hemoprotein beta-component n=1 Tax=Trinickia symbiotica TaxID=863227 RepID=A0A2N7X2K7_9BURK|nr:NADPH-dependent assimilatory sulfite reductase hemoprotein subunit [Trinickia symbiotica]PMS35811.1 NADPH-dependent assimilatory sulfite reductase hemoprotein subunit [Trinickia symbiotica]PPK44553.1 sulfite reductase (NADPH) beta subunit [Trinickia symbiotica]